MSSELSLFEEFNLPVEVPQQAVFDWGTMIADTKSLRKQEEELTDRIKRDLADLNEVKFKIGVNLLVMQDQHANHKDGDFAEFAMQEFDVRNRQSLYDYMHVAENLGKYIVNGRLQYSWEVMRLLGQPSMPEVVVTQVIDGTIEPTPKSIKEAKQALLEEQSKTKELQKKFDYYKQHEEQNKELLNARIDDLEKEISEAQAKQKPEDTPETKERLKQLEAELQERTQQRDNLAQLREQLSKELDEQRDANKARRERELYEHKINDRVKKSAEEWGKHSVTFLGNFPSPIESQVVAANNWALLDHAADMAQKIIDAVKQAKISKDAVFLNSEVPDASEHETLPA